MSCEHIFCILLKVALLLLRRTRAWEKEPSPPPPINVAASTAYVPRSTKYVAINISDFLFSRRSFSLPFLNIFRGLLTDDHSPGNFSAGQSILLQSCVSGPSGFAAAQFESGNVLYWPLDTCCRHKILRVWTPLPHVLVQGRQPDTYQLKQVSKMFSLGCQIQMKEWQSHNFFS